MALGLIKTTERVDLVCKSDPAIGKDSDEWVEVDKAKGAKKKGATVVTVRALNDREMMRCSSSFQAIDFEKQDADSTLQLAAAMEKVVETAFVRCTESEETTEDVEVVLHSIKTGPLLTLGSWILNASGMGSDPT
tara:strand:- start:613 stop:1017 length:405 start_codon:yes stop_codon:yes gene_type:complete